MARAMCAALALVWAMLVAPPAQAHLVRPFHKNDTHEQRVQTIKLNIHHVCASKSNTHVKGCKWLRGLLRKETEPRIPWYITKQIWAGNILGSESKGDPWPNCPDPFDGGYSWQDTVNCENNGSWLDSPGYYRCGLQFDPGWEARFGRLCP